MPAARASGMALAMVWLSRCSSAAVIRAVSSLVIAALFFGPGILIEILQFAAIDVLELFARDGNLPAHGMGNADCEQDDHDDANEVKHGLHVSCCSCAMLLRALGRRPFVDFRDLGWRRPRHLFPPRSCSARLCSGAGIRHR